MVTTERPFWTLGAGAGTCLPLFLRTDRQRPDLTRGVGPILSARLSVAGSLLQGKAAMVDSPRAVLRPPGDPLGAVAGGEQVNADVTQFGLSAVV